MSSRECGGAHVLSLSEIAALGGRWFPTGQQTPTAG